MRRRKWPIQAFMNERERVGTCSCGRLEVTCEGEPLRVSICHCLACQKRSGSAFAAQARWPSERVRLRGEAKEWTRIGDEGGRITFHFCETCAATISYEIDGMPGITAVPIGVLGDTSLPTPVYSVYEARMHPWVRLPDGIEHMD